MTAKALAIEVIQNMPDDATPEDIIEALDFRLAVDEGIRQVDAGEGIPHEEVKAHFAKWLE